MSKKYQINFIYRHTKMYVQATPQNMKNRLFPYIFRRAFTIKRSGRISAASEK